MEYNVIIRRYENSGPVNVAISLAVCAYQAGYRVTVFCLSKTDDVRDFEGILVSRLTVGKALNLSGIVHSHSFFPDLVNAALKCFLFKKKYHALRTIHNQFEEDLGYLVGWLVLPLLSILNKIVGRIIGNNICLTAYMRKYYRDSRMTGFDSRVIPNPVPIYKPLNDGGMAVTQKGAFHMQALKLLYVGAFIERKKIVDLARKIDKAGPGVQLICIGAGPLQADLEKIGNNVQVLPPTPNLNPYLESADYLVLPSSSEGFPLVVLEARFAGLPCLCSDIPPHREMADLGLCTIFNMQVFKPRALPPVPMKSCDLSLRQFLPENIFRRYEQTWTN